MEAEALVLQGVDQLVREGQLEGLAPLPRVPDHDEALAAVVVEAEHLFSLDGFQSARERLVLAEQADQLQ